MGSGRSSAAARSRPQCRAGDFARRLGHCGMAGFAGRCKHRPLRMRGRFLASFAGYLRRRAAMHPSGCALRRIHRPVCGARIALRALKHTCVLRPLHLLRLAVSAAGGARLRSPLQGSLPNGRRQQSRQNKYSPEHGGSGLYCFVPRPRSGGPYSEITEANGRRDKPAHGGKPGAEAPHAASPNCAGGPLR